MKGKTFPETVFSTVESSLSYIEIDTLNQIVLSRWIWSNEGWHLHCHMTLTKEAANALTAKLSRKALSALADELKGRFDDSR